jgi:hypothetical protein
VRRRDLARYRARGTTEQRGLGSEHRKARADHLAAYVEGQPCVLCGRPLLGPGAGHDLEHEVPRALGGRAPRGLAHRHCNRSAGAAFGNRLRGRAKRTQLPRW